jgi:hypothetical protein
VLVSDGEISWAVAYLMVRTISRKEPGPIEEQLPADLPIRT